MYADEDRERFSQKKCNWMDLCLLVEAQDCLHPPLQEIQFNERTAVQHSTQLFSLMTGTL